MVFARRVMALGLAAALVWVAPVLSTDVGTPPAAVSDIVTVTDWTRPAARATGSGAGLWTTSGVVPADGAVLVGADWGGDHDTQVQVRGRDGDTWGSWYDLPNEDEHQPDPGTEEAARSLSTASDPVWVGEVDDLQFRASRPLSSLAVHRVAMVGGDGLGWTPDERRAGQVDAAAPMPAVRTRASWGADESLKNGNGPDITQDVRFSIVHHIGGGYWGPGEIEAGCEQADDKIRSIYAYHTNSRGYDDIAYNFVVDPCGNVWEGRGGGITEAVQGAHAAGFNEGSVGVLALGTFSGDTPDPVTPEMVSAMERLLAWKLDLHHVDPDGVSSEIAGGGGSSRYNDGDIVDVPVLSAHQVTNSTTCPGDVLMSELFDGALAEGTPKDTYVQAVRTRGLPKAYGGTSAEWKPGDTIDGNEHREPLDPARPVWEVDFSGVLDWRLEITDAEGNLVRATGGRGESSMARTWDLRNEDGEPVGAGTYHAELTGTNTAGKQIMPIATDLMVRSGIGRIAGDTRITTAVELSKEAFESASQVVLASAAAYPDALVASPLAASLGGPVLLTPTDELADEVAEELTRLGTTKVHVVGGTVAVDRDVTDRLVALGFEVVRYAGTTRYDTAARVATVVGGREQTGEVLVALGNHGDPSRAFPDALAAGAFGATTGAPVLLTGPDALPSDTATALRRLAPTSLRIFGGVAAISRQLEARVETAAGIASVRFAGDDRFQTATLAATEVLARFPVLDDGGPTPPPNAGRASEDSTAEPAGDPSEESTEEPRTPRPVLLASGRNWPDALGAGAATAALGGVFVLVDDTELEQSAATSDFLEDNADIVSRILVAGGTVAVASRVVIELATLELGEAIDAGEPISWPADPSDAEPAEPATDSASPTASETETGLGIPIIGGGGSPSEDPSATASATSTASATPTGTAAGVRSGDTRTSDETAPTDTPSS